MNLCILCVGRLKEVFYKKAVEEYCKRIQPYLKMDIVEVADEPDPQQPSQHNIQLVKAKEAKKLSAKLRSDDYVIALCINAEQLSSEELAALFEEQQQTGTKRLVFVIGGSHGLDESIIARAQRRLSVSKMTFPHQLARLILAEQLYRAQKINSKEPYHK